VPALLFSFFFFFVLSASVELKRLYPHAKTAIGEHVKLVQKTFKAVYNDEKFDANGTQFDHLWKDGEEFFIGSLACRVLFTPGHTPSCTSLVIGDSVFTGDTLFLVRTPLECSRSFN
jgi:glyoxylase-like metal-dependent hydrolase (beta-lactamase superfamily II)